MLGVECADNVLFGTKVNLPVASCPVDSAVSAASVRHCGEEK